MHVCPSEDPRNRRFSGELRAKFFMLVWPSPFFLHLPSNAFPDIGSVGRIEKKRPKKIFFSMLLLCSFFRLKELFQVKNGVTTSLLFSFFFF